jgi:hypothetical protein
MAVRLFCKQEAAGSSPVGGLLSIPAMKTKKKTAKKTAKKPAPRKAATRKLTPRKLSPAPQPIGFGRTVTLPVPLLANAEEAIKYARQLKYYCQSLLATFPNLRPVLFQLEAQADQILKRNESANTITYNGKAYSVVSSDHCENPNGFDSITIKGVAKTPRSYCRAPF